MIISGKKQSIDESANTPISVKHASKKAHLSSHQNFFNALEEEARLDITKENLWLKKDSFFPEIKTIFFKP
jgi:CMP-N-acetylneuraminic acid synthetase